MNELARVKDQYDEGRRHWEFRCPTTPKATGRLTGAVAETFGALGVERERIRAARSLGLVSVWVDDSGTEEVSDHG